MFPTVVVRPRRSASWSVWTRRTVSRFLVFHTSTVCNDRCHGLWSAVNCEGGGDVVGVVTPLVSGVAQAFHDDRVVELRVQLGVQEVEGKEDRKGQVEVEEENRLKEMRPCL